LLFCGNAAVPDDDGAVEGVVDSIGDSHVVKTYVDRPNRRARLPTYVP
jgi:hypothetical protein